MCHPRRSTGFCTRQLLISDFPTREPDLIMGPAANKRFRLQRLMPRHTWLGVQLRISRALLAFRR
jgi:hypothetical protein